MSVEQLNVIRALVAAGFAEMSDERLPGAAREAMIEYGGTLIGPDDPDGPAEHQIEMLGVLGFGATVTAAARQWTGNVSRMLNPDADLEDMECE